MVTFTLKDYVSEIGQVKAGKNLGVTQIAISKALRSGRNIFVQVSDRGVAAFEAKNFPAKSKDNLNHSDSVVGIVLSQ
ncbi:Cro/CI family transcriptional regulator [Serratia sp. 2C06]|uniref:Cro/CI family transcriptional regulator n=1 Tax=Serratia sp. 2C06 TaxID=3416180 RepID=UPI003CF1442F